ncbi:hypothetical protein SLA2020_306220 [Shorea laevis]
MLEGVVQRVLLGLLGRYVKDFSRDQVKVTLWNTEVELKDIQLILEAFDYLQLPFALKQGRVGKLIVKVPWNLIGREPILIALEDVFFFVSPRDDDDWSKEAVESRELAGKKAKLAAAELAKLSRRVSCNKGGWSFFPYVTTKVLENIQVSIKNFHVVYSNMQSDSEQMLFGLRFSSLIISKANPIGGQVSKTIDIEALEIYCSSTSGAANFRSLENTEEFVLWCNSSYVGDKFENLLEPFNVSISLLVNRSDKPSNDLPQYSISAKLNSLVMALSEVHLRQILILLDYLSTSQLRERYGRYRPLSSPLSRKEDGWQRLWWCYAQESIISDVHKKLKKSSWRYLGQRLSNRRKYVSLYKSKLGLLRHDLPIDESILWELDQMEKESDIDDILRYRSAAELELQELLAHSSTANICFEKSRKDDHPDGKLSGWLNWLSHGMLGAGGTDDSSHFSGIVSDEDVQDIYDAAKFHPPVFSGADSDENGKMSTCAIEFGIDELTLTVRNSCCEIAKLYFHGVVIECKLQDQLTTLIVFHKSGEIIYPLNKKVILLMVGSCMDKNVRETEPLYRVQMDLSPKQDVKLSVMLPSLEVAYEKAFFLDLMEFFNILKSFEFQPERVLSSLNGFEDDSSRLLAKAEFILSNHKKVVCDVSIINVILDVPLTNTVSEQYNMVLELGSLILTSKPDLDSPCSSTGEQSDNLKLLLDSVCPSLLISFQLQDLYNHFEIKIADFQMKLVMAHYHSEISVLEKFCSSVTLSSCIIPNEEILKQLEVCAFVSPLLVHISPLICESVVALIALLDNLNSASEPHVLDAHNSLNSTSRPPRTPLSGVNITTNFEAVNILVDFANGGENGPAIMISLNKFDLRYDFKGFEELWICSKALEIIAYQSRNAEDGNVLCTSGNLYASRSAHQHEMCDGLGDQTDYFSNKNASSEACFLLHYEVHRCIDFVRHKCKLCLSDADLHCYPYVFGLLMGFFDRIQSISSFVAGENSRHSNSDGNNLKMVPKFEFQRFGFSNFSEEGTSDYASISLDFFPFITICNSGSLTSLENSLRYSTLDWRKSLNQRNRKFDSPSHSREKGSKDFPILPLKSMHALDATFLSGNLDMYVIDVNLSGVRIHLHDSSCTVGILTLPNSKSSLCIYEDSMDLVSSTEGLILTSSWWTKSFQDFLWGPSLPNISPVLNIRVRKGSFESLNSQLEISFGIQHVCCVLPPEYLAIIVGYFSLPDWSSNSSMQPAKMDYQDRQTKIAIVYKFEILDSTLIFPVESDDHQCLKIELHQIYCSFIPECDLNNVLLDIPPGYMVPVYKFAKTNHSLNIFGRDLSLSLLLFKDDGFGSLMPVPGTEPISITLISSFVADVWVRMPCESESFSGSHSNSTCIISRIGTCQLNLDDSYSLDGLTALVEIINHLSLVIDESKSFTSDVLQFLQLTRSMKETGAVTPADSAVIFTEVRCCIESLLIQFHRLGNHSFLLEPVAKADMRFMCSVSLVNDIPTSLDISFNSLALSSLLNAVMLARCIGTCSAPPVFKLSFSKSDQGVNELNVYLPSLHIWMHSSDWTEIINLLNSYALKVSKTRVIDSSSKSSTMDTIGPFKNVLDVGSQVCDQNSGVIIHHEPQNVNQATVGVIVRSENIGLTVRFPIWVTGEALSLFEAAEIQEERPQSIFSDVVEGKYCKFLTMTTHSRSSELLMVGKDIKLKCILEKTSCSVVICGDKRVNSWPFFHIFQINAETEICVNERMPFHVNVGVQCDRLDVWLSHQVFFFWHDLQFDFPEAGSSEHTFGNVKFRIQLRKASLLLSDGRWNCSGPLLEILLRNFLLDAHMTQSSIESTVLCDLQVNYNNSHKVLWEPFVEPWKFQISVNRKLEMNALLDSSFLTDIDLTSTAQLNFNLTEPLIETVLRTIDMFKDAWGLMEQDVHENRRLLNCMLTEKMSGGRYAPYVLQNLTSLPLVYRVYQGLVDSDQFDVSEMKDGKSVLPGATVPIYLNDTPEEQLFRYRPAHSSDKLSEKQPNGVVHHLMTIQLDGSPVPSAPVSIDLVGVTYFEVDFSNATKYNMNVEEKGTANTNTGFVVPVVFDVSVQRYSKLIQLYSTVIILNATSMPIELRFDIPFGIAPKILDPIYPGQKFPLPLHLAESGRMRWRPHENSYLWSEVHNLHNILSQESKIGFLRSFVCYPSHPSSDPFRCCFSLERICLPTAVRPKKGSMHHVNNLNQSVRISDQILNDLDKSKSRFIHQVTLSTPLIVNNYLPETVSLKIEIGGVTRTTLLSEVVTFFHHVDPSHDLVLEFSMHGFRPSIVKFPRAETFSTMAKFSGTKFSLSETLAFDSDLCNGPIYMVVERTMDAFSGARELFISVPFLLYNCTAFPLVISECTSEMKGIACTMPSCYDQFDQEQFQGRRDGLSLLFSDQDSLECSFTKVHTVSTRKISNPLSGGFLSKSLTSSGSSKFSNKEIDRHDLRVSELPLSSLKNRSSSSTQLLLNDNGFVDKEQRKVKACMYSPHSTSASNEILVCLNRCLPGFVSENMSYTSWSAPFPLVPPSGSMNVLVPQPSTNGAFIISVACSAIAGQFAGRTRAITFQPRYIISNACSKDLSYKQKGTDTVFYLCMGHHSQLHWTDTTRELLLSMRFDEPGWQWSGSFLPDHLGDTQVKVRNYVSGAVKMIRVEVQNADVFVKDEKIAGSLHGNCGTNLILLSEDNTGYMPYRIDNFSKERLRIYQQRCESFDTIVHPYTSCPYAWDEPCYPHRLTVEVPGERIVGSYALDDLKEFIPVQLQSTFEKPERTLLLSICAEGAMKVLSIIDSSYHILKDVRDQSATRFLEKRIEEKNQEKSVNYKKRVSITIPCIGISLINSFPQELLFACAKNMKVDLLQSVDQQTLTVSVSSLQIDNQLQTTPYPVILFFNNDCRTNQISQIIKDSGSKYKNDRGLAVTSDGCCEPVFYLYVAKWRKKDSSLVSFQNMHLRVVDFCLELEQELILSLLYFFKALSPSFQSQVIPFSDSTYSVGIVYGQPTEYVKPRDMLQGTSIPVFGKSDRSNVSLPSIVPIGAPWQKIYLLASRERKIYVESLNLDPIKFTLSFSSSPWMLRNGVLTSGEFLIHRGLMALADVEGARIYLKELTIAHQMASWESIQEILIRHYTRQLIHEIYKVFGSAGVIGNPMGFARSVSVGIKDFLSVPVRSIMKSPTGLITGMAQGTTSLVSNTVYALSDAATQFSKVAHKGIVAFTFDDQAVARMENQQKGEVSHSKGVINEVFQGLTGLLQSPIKEVEKHGLPGILSGIALGVTGLVARPAASILEVTGKTAQSIRNRSSLHNMKSQCYRVRLPRTLSSELPLRPYSWEEAVGTSVLMEADDGLRLKEEVFVMCKALKQPGEFVIITERVVLIVSCSSLVDLGKPDFRGVAVNPEWVIETEISLHSVIHTDLDDGVVHIVGSSSDAILRQNQNMSKKGGATRTQWNNPTMPLFQTNLELASKEDAEEFLRVLLSTIEQGKERGWDSGYLLHQSNIK